MINSGNIKEEITYTLLRTRAWLQVVGLVLILLHFALPFVLLLMRPVKENRKTLAAVALGILAMRQLDIFWWVEPAYPHLAEGRSAGQYFYWLLDVGALAAVGGAWVWWFVWQLRKRPLLPLRDP